MQGDSYLIRVFHATFNGLSTNHCEYNLTCQGNIQEGQLHKQNGSCCFGIMDVVILCVSSEANQVDDAYNLKPVSFFVEYLNIENYKLNQIKHR